VNSIKSVLPASNRWLGAQINSVPNKKLGWVRKKLVLKMTAWKDGFEVFDGPNNLSWLGFDWLVQFGVVRGVICKVGLTLSRSSEQSRAVEAVGTTIQQALGEVDRQLSRPAENALLWQGSDGTVILQAPPGLVIVYFNSLAAINAAVWQR